MAWIELHQSLFDHRKTMEAADALDLPEVHVVGHLAALWCWCLDNAPDGILPDSRRIIAKGARWTGDPDAFVAALLKAGFIGQNTTTHGELEIANWSQYGGKLADRKRENAAKQARYRDRQKAETATSPAPNDRVTVTLPSRYALEERREEKSTEQDRTRSASGNARETKPRGKHHLPDAWVPPMDDEEAAAVFELPVQVLRAETEKFRDHWRSNGEQKLDWSASWRNWMRRVVEFAPKSNGRAPNGRLHGTGPKLLTSADLARMAQEGSDRERTRNPSAVVDSEFRLAEPPDHG